MPSTAQQSKLTKQQVEFTVSRGTTDEGKVRCLYVDDNFALVKWPGGSFWSGMGGNSYCSPWVEWYPTEKLVECFGKGYSGMRHGKQVWDCSHKKDGRLTTNRIARLITKFQKESRNVRHESPN